jgi:dihydroorotate dehydrogenase electron transfer subunit
MRRYEARVARRAEPRPEHVELLVDAPELAVALRPGQFAHVLTPGRLRRPISFSRVTDDGLVGLLFRVVGDGTRHLAERRVGDALDLIAPLGQGFPDPGPGAVALVGGGVGIPPLFAVAQRLSATHPLHVILGARSRDALLMDEDFRALGLEPTIVTDDGSFGETGRVTGPLSRWLERTAGGQVMACGPEPMLAAVARLTGIGRPCWLAYEQRMGCGVGACLACVVPGVGADGRPEWLRVCSDGPVFPAERLWWDGGWQR